MIEEHYDGTAQVEKRSVLHEVMSAFIEKALVLEVVLQDRGGTLAAH